MSQFIARSNFPNTQEPWIFGPFASLDALDDWLDTMPEGFDCDVARLADPTMDSETVWLDSAAATA
jgi:hypothetical protein